MAVADPLKTLAAAILDGINVADDELRGELVELRDRGIDAVVDPTGPDEPVPTPDPEV